MEPKAPHERLETPDALPAIRERAPQRHTAAGLQTPPRLSVRHLLLWIAACAVVMAAVRHLSAVQPGAWGLLLVSGYAATCGAAWVGLGVWVVRAARGATWPVEPGHWLLVVLGVRLALDLAIQLWLPRAFTSPESVLEAAVCACLVLPLLSRALSAIWESGFYVLLAIQAAPLTVAVLDGWLFWPPLWLARSAEWIERSQSWLMALVVLGCAAFDWPERRQRGWLHWLGLAVCFGMALAAVLLR
jgi:hypothetical protein